jgi:uncharacterized protein
VSRGVTRPGPITADPFPTEPLGGAVRFVALGFFVGVLSGLLGVGGGVILVPILVLGFRFAQKPAQATSLAAIVLTASSGAFAYLIQGHVLVIPALAMAAGGIAGTFIGAEVAHRMSENQVRVIFGIVMIAAGIRMAFGGALEGGESAVSVSAAAIAGFAAIGLVLGTLSALVGVGGGTVLVPILVIAFAFTPQVAQGTSLLVMIPIALVGAWRNGRHGYTQWRNGLCIGFGGVLGAPLGAAIAFALPGTWLQRAFAALLVISAVKLFLKVRSARGAQRQHEGSGTRNA